MMQMFFKQKMIEYEKRKKSIERNLELVQQYEGFGDWFFLEYKDLLKI